MTGLERLLAVTAQAPFFILGGQFLLNQIRKIKLQIKITVLFFLANELSKRKRD